MKEKLKGRNFPNLRFPNYTDEWKERRLEDLGFFIGGGTPDTTNQQFWTGKIPWISSSDLSVDDIGEIFKTRFINDNAIKSSATKLIPKGGILMVSRVGIGKFAVADEDLCTSQDFTNLVTNQNAYFLCYYFSTRSKYFVKLSQGTSIKGFTIQDIRSSVFPVPTLQEQENISSFLSVIDSRIRTQRKIIDKLETLMKVSRRSIFSHQMKFKNAMGNCFPNWNLTALKNVCSIIGGGTPDTQNSEYWNGNIQWFTPSEIKSNFILKSERTISELGLKNSSARILPQGTVLLTTRATIGEAAIAQEECSTNQGFQSLIVNENCHNVFLLYWIKENKFEFIKRANGSTFPEISKSEIKQIKVRIPDLEEQTKIGDFLSSIDEKIETEQNILTQYELQKKYLLANLFV